MKYRKKPVVIEAMQLNGNLTQILNWVGDCKHIVEDYGRVIIKTLEGEMTASPKDWIIKGVQGEFYPCKPDIFEQTYEKVEE